MSGRPGGFRGGFSRNGLRRIGLLAIGLGLRLVAPHGPARLPDRPRVLLIRPDHLGDLVLTSPAVELLRRALPEAHLAMMVGPWSAEVARRDSLLDEVLLCPFPGFTRAPRNSGLAPYRLLLKTASGLRSGRYDAALVLRFDHWWGAWLAAQAGIPIRVGYGVGECKPFLTHTLNPAGGGHWTARALRVAERLLDACSVPRPGGSNRPASRFGILQTDEREAERLWSVLRLNPRGPVVVFHPGTGSPLKLWPEERWIGLGWELAARGALILVTGSQEEAGMAERIAAAVPDARSLGGRTALGTLAALYRRCRLVVGTDNGPLHLAVAMGVPTVHLFGPTDPEVYGPWGAPRRHRVVSAGWPGAPCGRLDLRTEDGEPPACMKAIEVEPVLGQCLDLLNATTDGNR